MKIFRAIAARYLGFLLLWVGFLWLCLLQFNDLLRVGIRAVVAQQSAVLRDTTEPFSRQDVHEQIVATALRAQDMLVPNVLVPALLMFVGAVLVGASPSCAASAPNKSVKPNSLRESA